MAFSNHTFNYWSMRVLNLKGQGGHSITCSFKGQFVWVIALAKIYQCHGPHCQLSPVQCQREKVRREDVTKLYNQQVKNTTAHVLVFSDDDSPHQSWHCKLCDKPWHSPNHFRSTSIGSIMEALGKVQVFILWVFSANSINKDKKNILCSYALIGLYCSLIWSSTTFFNW